MESPTCLSTFSNLMGLKFQAVSLSNWEEQKSQLSFFTLQLLFSPWALWKLLQNTCNTCAVQRSSKDLGRVYIIFCSSSFYFSDFSSTSSFTFQLLWLFKTLFIFMTPQANRTSTFCPSASHSRDVI